VGGPKWGGFSGYIISITDGFNATAWKKKKKNDQLFIRTLFYAQRVAKKIERIKKIVARKKKTGSPGPIHTWHRILKIEHLEFYLFIIFWISDLPPVADKNVTIFFFKVFVRVGTHRYDCAHAPSGGGRSINHFLRAIFTVIAQYIDNIFNILNIHL